MSDVQTYLTAASAFVGALAGVGSLGFWLASRFNNVYKQISSTEKLLTVKIDAHEKMDIERFGKQDLAIMRVEMLMQDRGKSLHQI